jgi:hypothetical protein
MQGFGGRKVLMQLRDVQHRRSFSKSSDFRNLRNLRNFRNLCCETSETLKL